MVKVEPKQSGSEGLRCGLLGAGMMGREHLRNLVLFEDVKVVSICDTNEAMRARAQELVPEATLRASLPALLEDELDALVVATPNYLHAEQLLAILEAVSIPVLIEKPLVTRLEDVFRLRSAIQAHEAFVWVGMEYRFMPALQAFAAQRDQVGSVKMLSIREHRYPFLKKVDDWNRFNRFSGGTFVEKCCHFFDLMRLFLAAEPVKIYATAAQDVNHLAERYGGEQPDIWDNGYVVVDFDNGARGILDLCMFAEGVAFEQELSLVGDQARLDCRIPGPFHSKQAPAVEAEIIFSPRSPPGPIVETVSVPELALNAGSHQGATFFQHQAFWQAVRSGEPPLVDCDAGFKAVLMGLAAQASVSSGRAIQVDTQAFELTPI